MSQVEYANEPNITPAGRGDGFQDVVTVANPAVATGFTFQVDGAYIVRPVIVTYLYTSDANVANRFPVLQYEDGNGSVLAATAPNGAIVASKATLVTFALNLGVNLNALDLVRGGPLPDVFMQPGWLMRVVMGAGAAGDQLSGIRIVVDKFPTGTRPAAAKHRSSFPR